MASLLCPVVCPAELSCSAHRQSPGLNVGHIVLCCHGLLQLVLCGQTPEVIVDSALMAINFYVEQQRLSGMYSNHQLTQKMASIQQQCKKKLMEMQAAFQQVCAGHGSCCSAGPVTLEITGTERIHW